MQKRILLGIFLVGLFIFNQSVVAQNEPATFNVSGRVATSYNDEFGSGIYPAIIYFTSEDTTTTYSTVNNSEGYFSVDIRRGEASHWHVYCQANGYSFLDELLNDGDVDYFLWFVDN